MVFKINIAENSGKTYKLETDSKNLEGKELHDKIKGKEISEDLEGYELEITGASDKSGFTALKEVEGMGLSRVLVGYGKSMKNRPKKEGKIKRSKNKPKGLRLRKTVRGRIISQDIVQINLKVLKQGNKKLSEIFPEQNKKEISEGATSTKVDVEQNKSAEVPSQEKEISEKENKPEETKKQETPKEEKIEDKKE